jgi:hypothetical protein
MAVLIDRYCLTIDTDAKTPEPLLDVLHGHLNPERQQQTAKSPCPCAQSRYRQERPCLWRIATVELK